MPSADDPLRNKYEKKLSRKLSKILGKATRSVIASAERIINAGSPEKALGKLKIPYQDDYSDSVYDETLEMYAEEKKATGKRISKASIGYKKKAKINELTTNEKADAARFVGQQYKTRADALADEKWARAITESKSVIQQGIAGGWGMSPTYGYRFQDGSEATAADKKTYPSQVTREQVLPGLRDELKKTLSARSNPEAVARTEITRAFNEGVVDAGKDDDFVKGYEFLGVNDARQTDICSYLDGTRIDKNDPRVASITPALHVMCRSRLVEMMITDKRVANIDTRKIEIDGKKHNINDLDTRFGKAGTGAKAFNRPLAKIERKSLGVPDNGLVIRSAAQARKDFIQGKPQPDLVKESGGVSETGDVPAGYKMPSFQPRPKKEVTTQQQEAKNQTIVNLNELADIIDDAGPISSLTLEQQAAIQSVNDLF